MVSLTNLKELAGEVELSSAVRRITVALESWRHIRETALEDDGNSEVTVLQNRINLLNGAKTNLSSARYDAMTSCQEIRNDNDLSCTSLGTESWDVESMASNLLDHETEIETVVAALTPVLEAAQRLQGDATVAV